MSVGNITDKKPAPKAPEDTFSHKYFLQVDRFNVALRDYASTSCRSAEFDGVADKLTAEYKLLADMEQNIPYGEDEITKVHEVEVFYGVEVMGKIVYDMQQKCLNSDVTVSDPMVNVTD